MEEEKLDPNAPEDSEDVFIDLYSTPPPAPVADHSEEDVMQMMRDTGMDVTEEEVGNMQNLLATPPEDTPSQILEVLAKTTDEDRELHDALYRRRHPEGESLVSMRRRKAEDDPSAPILAEKLPGARNIKEEIAEENRNALAIATVMMEGVGGQSVNYTGRSENDSLVRDQAVHSLSMEKQSVRLSELSRSRSRESMRSVATLEKTLQAAKERILEDFGYPYVPISYEHEDEEPPARPSAPSTPLPLPEPK